MWNYGKLSAKFLVSSIKVIDTMGFLSFFKIFTRTTIKIPLNHCMIVKDNGKGQVTHRNKQTNKYFLHYKQLNTFDHAYHIRKYLDNEPSTFLLVNRYFFLK